MKQSNTHTASNEIPQIKIHKMIFHLHFILLASGLSGAAVLLGVFIQEYTDASQKEIGILLMSIPFVAVIIKPLFCSIADRHQSHKLVLIFALSAMIIGYSPFIILPYLRQLYDLNLRVSWYSIIIATHIGAGGLEVAWSLGDSLAINYAQKTGTSYGCMRLVGTLSWGIFSFIIGQFNEVSYFPRYVPAFFVLHTNILIEILLLIIWKEEDFIMSHSPRKERKGSKASKDLNNACKSINNLSIGSGQLIVETTNKSFSKNRDCGKITNVEVKNEKISEEVSQLVISNTVDRSCSRSLQIFLFKMILINDGRLAKYLLLFMMFGILMAPMNFVFLSLVEFCNDEGYNFSQLVGCIIISQSGVEGICFLFIPWALAKAGRTTVFVFAWSIMSARYYFYANFFYHSGISPYWSILAECGLGIAYAIFATNLAYMSIMFANQSKIFIPESQRQGYRNVTVEDGHNDETRIESILRATISATFGGALDGLGMGSGALISGILVGPHTYTNLWHFNTIMSISTMLIHLVIELTRCRWSDGYKPREGTLAHACRQNSKDE